MRESLLTPARRLQQHMLEFRSRPALPTSWMPTVRRLMLVAGHSHRRHHRAPLGQAQATIRALIGALSRAGQTWCPVRCRRQLRTSGPRTRRHRPPHQHLPVALGKAVRRTPLARSASGSRPLPALRPPCPREGGERILPTARRAIAWRAASGRTLRYQPPAAEGHPSPKARGARHPRLGRLRAGTARRAAQRRQRRWRARL